MLKNTTRSLLLATALIAAPLAVFPGAPAHAQLVELQSFAPLVKAVKPAVVTVTVEGQRGSANTPRIPDQFREFFERFGQEMPRPEQRPARGMGSGFVIDADGVIVTNNHVIDGAEKITVILDDGTELEAELIGRDQKIDIAVLRVSPDGPLATVGWGDSDEIEVGDWAVAIGNPLGLDGTVTAGIVSARGRDINSGPYDDYLQVDVPINRGNSGGPLFDVYGNVVGVNTAIISPSGGSVGLGFAIPSNQAQMIVADLMDDGLVERGFIGVSIQPVSRDIATSLGLPDANGALVAEITPDAPAAMAGVRPGDVIMAFGGAKIDEVRDLTRSVAAADVGAEVPLTVWRDGDMVTLQIRPRLMENATLALPQTGEDSEASPSVVVPMLGLAIEIKDDAVLVAEIESDAAKASAIRPGDRILSINQRKVETPADVAEIVADAENMRRSKVLLLVEREDRKQFITMDLTPS